MNPYREARLRLGYELQNRIYNIEREAADGNLPGEEAKKQLQDEWEHVLGVCAWCLEQPETDWHAAVLLSKLMGVAGHLVFVFQPVSEQIFWREKAYHAARRAELARDELGHGSQLAYLHFATGNLNLAHELLDVLLSRNEALVESIGDAKLNGQNTLVRSPGERQQIRAALLSHRGMFYAAHELHKNALPVLSEASNIYREQGDLDALSICLNTLAVAQAGFSNHEEAVKTLDEAIALSGTSISATAYINRGSYLLSLGRREEAWDSIKQGEKLAFTAGDRNSMALAAVQFGFWFAGHPDADKRAKTVEYLSDALNYYRSTGDRRQRDKVLNALESLFISVTHNTEANAAQVAEAWRRLSAVREELGDLAGEAEAVRNYLACTPDDLEAQLEGLIRNGHVCVKLQLHQDAVQAHTRALDVLARIRAASNKHKYVKAECELLLSLGQAHRHLGETEAALSNYERAKSLALASHDQEAEWRAEGNFGLLYVDKGAFEQAISSLEKVVKHYDKPQSGQEEDRLRLLGHARFNLAYACYKKGDIDRAKIESAGALHLLRLINDTAGVAQIEKQLGEWVNVH